MLLKAFDQRGFVFFTNDGSRKASAIAQQPAACLLALLWISTSR